MLGDLRMHPDDLIHANAYLKTDIPVDGVAHQAGTCRFGTDPAASVLDVNSPGPRERQPLRRGHKLLPSIGAVNPVLTAMANALRVGDHLLDRLGAA